MIKDSIFSIIVPVYNVEDKLPRCIDSILNQTYDGFELILVNDGSCDSSGEICDSYAKKDDRIIVLHQPNSGASSARNKGLAIAKNEYIYFVDSDDWIENDLLASFLPFLHKDIVFIGSYVHYPGGKEVEVILKEINACNTKSCINAFVYLKKRGYFGMTWCKLFRRSIINKNKLGFSENLKLREDELFTMQYCQHVNSLIVTQIHGYHYCLANGSLSRSRQAPDALLCGARMIRRASEFYNEYDEFKKFEDKNYLQYAFLAVLSAYYFSPISISVSERFYYVKEFCKIRSCCTDFKDIYDVIKCRSIVYLTPKYLLFLLLEIKHILLWVKNFLKKK